MYLGRTLPPVAVPFSWTDIINGLKGWQRGAVEIERLREEFCRYFNVRHCFLVSSGKAALFLILKVLRDLRPKCDTVLIPAFTCYSVPSAIVRAGLKVELCDVNPDTLDFDFDKLKCTLAAVSNDTSASLDKHKDIVDTARKAVLEDRMLAIIPTHLFGMAADIAKVRQLIAGRRIALVEDAAQAFGARSDGRFLGCNGDIGFFSLGRGKAFSAVEGGVIVTDRPELAERLETLIADLSNEGPVNGFRLLAYAIALTVLQHPSLYWLPQGLPFLHLGETVYGPNFPVRPFTAFQAGLVRGWQSRNERMRGMRDRQGRAWRQCLEALDGVPVRLLSGAAIAGNLIRFPLRVPKDTRAKILEDSRAKRLGVMPSYPDSIDGLAETIGQPPAPSFVQAHRVARELVTLPVHTYVDNSDRRKTIELLASHLDPS